MKRTLLTLTLVLGSTLCSQSFGFDLLDRMLGIKGCGSSCDTACCPEPTCGAEAPCEIACEPTCGAEALCEPTCGAEAPCFSEPTCGCEAPACGCAPSKGCGLLSGLMEPTCGAEAPCGVACEPTCGAEAFCEPECGCEVASCDSGCGLGRKSGGLLSKLFKGKSLCSKGCDSGCEMPACGCEEVASCDSGCDSACGKKSCGLLSKLFGNLRKKSNGCDSGCDVAASCGCSAPAYQYHAPTVAPTEAPAAPEAAPMPPAPIVDPSARVSSTRRVIQASASYTR